jgi:hypothetical protein
MLKKEDFILYLAKLLNLEIDKITLLRIKEKTSNFDLQDFIVFVENNLNNMQLSYKTPLQKFLTFCILYSSFLIAKQSKKFDNESEILAKKFRHIKSKLKNDMLSGKIPKLDFIINSITKENYFSKFEISILSKIGDIKNLILLDDSFKLEEKINRSLIITLISSNRQERVSYAK